MKLAVITAVSIRNAFWAVMPVALARGYPPTAGTHMPDAVDHSEALLRSFTSLLTREVTGGAPLLT
jgi:hypothetical protein